LVSYSFMISSILRFEAQRSVNETNEDMMVLQELSP